MEYIISSFGYDQMSRSHIINEETLMNKDQIKGRVKEVEGKVKEVTGKILDDKAMELEGNIKKNAGNAQAAFGDMKEDMKDDG